jgi:hypothetical protein
VTIPPRSGEKKPCCLKYAHSIIFNTNLNKLLNKLRGAAVDLRFLISPTSVLLGRDRYIGEGARGDVDCVVGVGLV